MGSWILENSLFTCGVMFAVFALCRLNRRRPALCHFLWVLAFIALVLPPLPMPSTPGTWVRSELASIVNLKVGESPVLENSLPFINHDTIPLAGAVATHPAALMPAPDLALLEPTPAAIESTPIATFQLILGLWALGACVFIGFSVWRILSFHRLVRRAPGAPHDLRGAVAAVALRLGVQAPAIRMIEGVGSPGIWCFGQPLLLWPSHEGQPVRHEGEPSLIAHELAHLARRDHWISRLDVVAIGACWWNPLFWIIRREIRYYAELACDAWALWAYPTERRIFAEALIDSQERTQIAPMAIEGLCATNSDFKNFERRLTMIMSRNVSRQVSKGAATAALLTTLLVLPGFSVQGESGGHEQDYGQEKATKNKKKGTTAPKCIEDMVEAKKLATDAEQFFVEKKYDDALTAYMQVLTLTPKDGKAHGRVGYILGGRGEYMKASAHFKKQVKLAHEVSTAIYNLSCMASLLGDQDKALALLQQSVRRGFTNADLMRKDTDLASLRSHAAYDRALLLSEEAMILRKDIKEMQAQGDSEALADSYYALGEIATEDGEIQDKCGLAFLLEKDYAAGLEAFKRQAAVGYHVGRAHYNIACAHALLGNRDKALWAIEKAADLGMDYVNVTQDADLASLRDMKRFQLASERLMARTKMKSKLKKASSPDDLKTVSHKLDSILNDKQVPSEQRAWAAYELGRLQMKTGQTTASIRSFQKAAEAGYAASSAAFQIGSAHAQLGQADKALKYYEQSLLLGYGDAKLMLAALTEINLADTDEGRELVKRAKTQSSLKKKKKKASYDSKLKKKEQEARGDEIGMKTDS